MRSVDSTGVCCERNFHFQGRPVVVSISWRGCKPQVSDGKEVSETRA